MTMGGAVVTIGGVSVVTMGGSVVAVSVAVLVGVLTVGVIVVAVGVLGVRRVGDGDTLVGVDTLASCVLWERLVATAAVAVELFRGISTRANSRKDSSGVRTQRNPRSCAAVDGSAI